MILKVVHQVVLVMPIQPTLFVSGFRRTAVGFRLFSAERVDAFCLSTLRFFNNLLGFNPSPLGAKVFDSHSNTQLFAVAQFILVFGSSLKATNTLIKQSQSVFYRGRTF